MSNTLVEGSRPIPVAGSDLEQALARARRAEAYADRMARLLALADYLSLLSTRADVANAILQQAHVAAGAIAGVVYCYDAPRHELGPIDTGEGRATLARGPIPADAHDPIATTARRGESSFFPTPNDLFARYPELGARVDENRVANAYLPLEITGRVLGTLALAFPQDSPFPENDRPFLAALAQQCATALHRLDAERELDLTRTRLAQSEKLSALGGMVSGVAHELRTPLTYLQNNLFIIQRRTERLVAQAREAAQHAAELNEAVEGAVESADRINRLVDSLRRYYRLKPGTSNTCDLHATVREAVRLHQATHAGVARVHLDGVDVPPLRADAVQVQQVVLNLLANATQASPDSGDVTITVRPLRSAGGGEIIVTDRGIGMSAETLARIYDPFFTTREDGTGLGMGIVKRIVEDHGGTIKCTSAPGAGTTFRLTFPGVASDAAQGLTARP